MQRQREEWEKGSGRTERNGDCESQDMKDFNKSIHSIHMYIT